MDEIIADEARFFLFAVSAARPQQKGHDPSDSRGAVERMERVSDSRESCTGKLLVGAREIQSGAIISAPHLWHSQHVRDTYFEVLLTIMIRDELQITTVNSDTVKVAARRMV